MTKHRFTCKIIHSEVPRDDHEVWTGDSWLEFIHTLSRVCFAWERDYGTSIDDIDVVVQNHTIGKTSEVKAVEYLRIENQTDLAFRIVEQRLPADVYVRRREEMQSRDLLIRNFIGSELIEGEKIGEGDITPRPYGKSVLNLSGAEKLAEFLSVTPDFKVERDDAHFHSVQCHLLQDENVQMPIAGTGVGSADTIEGAKDFALIDAIRSLTATEFLIERWEAEGYESYLDDMKAHGVPYKSFDEWEAWQIYG